MSNNSVKSIAIAATLLATANVAQGQDLEFGLSIGQMTGMAQELVYDTTDGRMVSQLDWNLQSATVINVDAIIPVAKDFSISIAATTGINGDNYMNDYDWLDVEKPDAPDAHSWHDDTVLDHYFSLDIAARYNLSGASPTQFSLIGGLHYVDVKWSSYGGCFDYKFKNSAGCWAEGTPAISYQQMLPAAYVGLGLTHRGENWFAAAELNGGVSFLGYDIDNHWMPNLQFVDYGSLAPFVAAKAQIGFAISKSADVFVQANFQKYFEQKGPTELYSINSGAYRGTSSGEAAGLSWESVAVSAGVKFHF